jgi:hypothetical protein
MKNLKDVLEKLKIDDIIFDVFPIDGTIDDVIKFIERQGFKDINERGGIAKRFSSHKNKCFVYIEDARERLWFADTSKEKISKDNPIFLIKYNPKFSSNYEYCVYYRDNDLILDIVENDKKEFLEELNKRFGWE